MEHGKNTLLRNLVHGAVHAAWNGRRGTVEIPLSVGKEIAVGVPSIAAAGKGVQHRQDAGRTQLEHDSETQQAATADVRYAKEVALAVAQQPALRLAPVSTSREAVEHCLCPMGRDLEDHAFAEGAAYACRSIKIAFVVGN